MDGKREERSGDVGIGVDCWWLVWILECFGCGVLMGGVGWILVEIKWVEILGL